MTSLHTLNTSSGLANRENVSFFCRNLAIIAEIDKNTVPNDPQQEEDMGIQTSDTNLDRQAPKRVNRVEGKM